MQSNEEIVRMARDSGLWYKVGFPKEIERFAALVAAAEREACARVCEENADDDSEGDWDNACNNCAYHIRARGEKK